MSEWFDTIVIGSGFGGGVMACRLAEKGQKVLVLERGRRWDKAPHELDDRPWIYDPDQPENQNGWLDLRFMDDMVVALGAAVGGGSLIYANVSVEAPCHIFNKGWPKEIDHKELEIYYRRVGKMLDVQVLPDNQLTPRYHLMKEGAKALGFEERFGKVPLAVTFDKDYSYELEDPFDRKHSKTFTNKFDREQGTCIHLGYCDIGCPVKAKNTIDLNYLALAEQKDAEVRPLHLVRCIKPEPKGAGYRVTFDRIADRRLYPGHACADRVVVAAGSLGSTELLLRCRDQYKTLPKLSRFLGHNWSANGDFLTPAFYDKERQINPTKGPTISSAIDFLDGSEGGNGFYIEDGGLPDLLEAWIHSKLERGVKGRLFRKLLREAEGALERSLSNVMPWFAQGIDAADGRLYLGRKWYAPWQRMLKLDWDIERSEETMDAILAMHQRLSKATGGDPWTPPTYSLFANLATPHPLGGCNMGDTAESGVVNHRGEVFGYPDLYVMDGAIIPEAIGRNPSRTIAALAERAADLL